MATQSCHRIGAIFELSKFLILVTEKFDSTVTKKFDSTDTQKFDSTATQSCHRIGAIFELSKFLILVTEKFDSTVTENSILRSLKSSILRQLRVGIGLEQFLDFPNF